MTRGAVTIPDFRTVAETASTNDDVAALARAGAVEGLWLRADRQSAGRGRQGRGWVSPPGNLYASTLVRLAGGEPVAPSLALVAAVALHEAVSVFLPFARAGEHVVSRSPAKAGAQETQVQRFKPWAPASAGELLIKWPNDLLLGGAKLSGILLERGGDAVVIGFGVNLAHHPDDLDRAATSLAANGGNAPDPDAFLAVLADGFARWLGRWRSEGLAPIRTAWLARAHPVDTALSVRFPDGDALDGLFDGLDESGALRLRLADGSMRVIHAADVFMIRD